MKIWFIAQPRARRLVTRIINNPMLVLISRHVNNVISSIIMLLRTTGKLARHPSLFGGFLGMHGINSLACH